MSLSSLRPITLLLLATLFLDARLVNAICLQLPRQLIVGDTASDSSCQYNDIQSAIDSASTNPDCSTVIHITREHLYNQQHLTIENRNITMAGWGDGFTCAVVRSQCDFVSCPLPPASINPLVTLSGRSGDSVLHIDGDSDVSLLNLQITGGTVGSDQSGGGIYYEGTGALMLASTTVNLNHAGYGGGINVKASGGPAILTLNAYSQILVNTADVSGGGIRLQGDTRLYALQPHTLIGFNHAPNGYGGGIEVLGPARADIGSSGYGGLGVIHGNDAAYGGGMDILTFEHRSDAFVHLFTTDPHNPVRLSANAASHTGGAVYLRSLGNFSDYAKSVLCSHNFRIDDNSAPEGAAIYSDADYDVIANLASGGSVVLNTGEDDACAGPDGPPELGAVACAADVPCSTLTDNTAEDINGSATDGSIVLMQPGSTLKANRFSARRNTGGHLIREVGDVFGTYSGLLANCLLADNTLTQELVAQTDGMYAQFSLDSCTVVGNTIGTASYTFLAPAEFAMKNSIIDQPGHATVNPPIDDGSLVDYVLTNDLSSLPNTTHVFLGQPTFVDAQNGDYHLRRTSRGVDSAPIDSDMDAATTDLDRKPRVVDLPDFTSDFGPLDLGAYEIQPSCSVNDTLFCNGFDGS